MIVYLLSKIKWKGSLSLRFIFGGISPFLIGLFFCLNFTFTKNDRNALYDFSWNAKNANSITIDNGKYQSSPWITTFFNHTDIQGYQIIFKEADGLFGLPVVKSYLFNQKQYWRKRY